MCTVSEAVASLQQSLCAVVQEAAASSSTYAAEKASQEKHILALQVNLPLHAVCHYTCFSLAADLSEHCAALDLKPWRFILNVVLKKSVQTPSRTNDKALWEPRMHCRSCGVVMALQLLYSPCQ